ncbi:hypothetical protein DSCW_09080 [Desulfosarcina widdelii]|uniref:Uncharacterized protein n=1 Tax=Desulfosarcina widdelii TaxID=947919 RepID=A0A5K7Z1W2_9BACT|nr:hypothetical protein DSCW_09080 [Desulfosarcina widdelii]
MSDTVDAPLKVGQTANADTPLSGATHPLFWTVNHRFIDRNVKNLKMSEAGVTIL